MRRISALLTALVLTCSACGDDDGGADAAVGDDAQVVDAAWDDSSVAADADTTDAGLPGECPAADLGVRLGRDRLRHGLTSVEDLVDS